MADQTTKTIIVGADIDTVYDTWANFENFPHFMKDVKSVTRTGDRMSHWVVQGPLGKQVEWDAETTRLVPGELVSWRSVEGAAVRHAGTLRFDRLADGRARVHVQMSYNPPAGAVGHAVATLLGSDPRHRMNDDLARLKTTIETGVPPRDAAQVEAVR